MDVLNFPLSVSSLLNDSFFEYRLLNTFYLVLCRGRLAKLSATPIYLGWYSTELFDFYFNGNPQLRCGNKPVLSIQNMNAASLWRTPTRNQNRFIRLPYYRDLFIDNRLKNFRLSWQWNLIVRYDFSNGPFSIETPVKRLKYNVSRRGTVSTIHFKAARTTT